MMCTVAEEAAPASPFAVSEPHNQKMYAVIGLTYLFALKWQSGDRALAREVAAYKEENPELFAHAAETHAEAAAPAAEAAPVSSPSAVVSAVAAVGTTHPVAEWKVGDVSEWLASIELPMHVDAFKSHSVNGKMLLALSDQDLYSTLSVVSPLHRKKLLMEISALRKSYLSM
jgi:hypothetical protein